MARVAGWRLEYETEIAALAVLRDRAIREQVEALMRYHLLCGLSADAAGHAAVSSPKALLFRAELEREYAETVEVQAKRLRRRVTCLLEELAEDDA